MRCVALGIVLWGVFFVSVNQVLVRLWACFAVASLTGLLGCNEPWRPQPRANAFRGVVVAVRCDDVWRHNVLLSSTCVWALRR